MQADVRDSDILSKARSDISSIAQRTTQQTETSLRGIEQLLAKQAQSYLCLKTT